jgi:divalent metal cation (Fe/Co/Zn/Cd) transporter
MVVRLLRVEAVSGQERLLRRGLWLEYVTLGWNVVGVVILAIAALGARSVALAGFGLDSLIEIVASTVVVWQLTDTGGERERTAMRVIGGAFIALAIYIAAQTVYLLATGGRPESSPLGITWTAVTCVAMLSLAYGKARTGAALDNPVLRTEGRVTLVDAYLAGAVLVGLALNAAFGWWWADPLAGCVIVVYGLREGWAALQHHAAGADA